MSFLVPISTVCCFVFIKPIMGNCYSDRKKEEMCANFKFLPNLVRASGKHCGTCEVIKLFKSAGFGGRCPTQPQCLHK